jgi:hypothetical protein
MKNYFAKIFHHKRVRPARPIEQIFKKRFPKALNVEWDKIKKGYEALFHERETEKIVHFDHSGQLFEIRTNLCFDQLPDIIRWPAQTYGELMNAIRIERKSTTFFEIIFRDKMLVRYQLIFDDAGNVLKNEVL